MDNLNMKWLLLKTYFGLNKQTLIEIMVHLMEMNLPGKAKTSDMVTVIFEKSNSIPFTKFLCFVACRVTSKVLGIDEVDRSWGDIKTIKYGKRAAIRIYLSQKQSIFYTYIYIESDRIEQYHSGKKLIDNCSSHTCNEEDDDFDQQLEKWCIEFFFQINHTLLQER